jgi:hypothetical protein
MPSPTPICSPHGEAFARSHSLVPPLRVVSSTKNDKGVQNVAEGKPAKWTLKEAAN